MIPPEQAIDVFIAKFDELHPDKSIPKWFATHTDLEQFYDKKSNTFKFAVISLQKKELAENESYEEVNGM